MIISRAPYRLSLFGGGTDYPEFFETEGSTIIAASFDRYCYITLRTLPPFFSSHTLRLVYSRIEAVMSADQLDHPSARACLKELGIGSGLEIHYDGDLPAKSGVGSSSAFTVALLKALYTYLGTEVSKSDLCKKAIEIEHDILLEPVGIQDQTIAVHGGIQLITCGPGKTADVRPLAVSHASRERLESALLVGYFGEPRLSRDHSRHVVEGIKNESQAKILKDIRSLAQEAQSVMEAGCDLASIGSLLRESWDLKFQQAFDKHSLEVFRDMINKAVGLGAYGGKLMGAGGSGFFFVLADPELQERIRSEMPNVKFWTTVKFSQHGAQSWNLNTHEGWS